MSEQNTLDKLEDVLRATADIASDAQSKVGLFALIGFIASASLAWLLYSTDSSLTWNIVKCGIVLLPALVLYSLWLTLGRVIEAPRQISELSSQLSDEDGLVSNLESLGVEKPNSVRGLISTVRAIRNHDGLGGITDALGGIAVLSNPAFILLIFVNAVILLLLIIVAPLVLIF